MKNENLSLFQAFQNTPPLWFNTYDGLEQFNFPSINVQNLNSLHIPQNLRLGHQLEYIFHQLLLGSNNYNVLGSNIPIRKDKITLGELDFILQNTENKDIIHLELTYKFYIITANKNTKIEHQLIGPNHRDTFLQKKEKLINHQLPLSRSEEGKEILIKYGVDASVLTSQVCYKSQLFTPYFNREMKIAPFNKACISGTWISYEDFCREEFQSYQYYIPSKLEWVLPPHNKVEWRSYLSILDDISSRIKNKRAPLLWVKNTASKIEKMFILWRSP
ncbi:MAG: DUF1853 family protein [Arenibacter latericius]|nr:DUF1853 family protein [Arenibacter latericius]